MSTPEHPQSPFDDERRIHEGALARARLASLGLEPEWLESVAADAAAAAATVTRFHPRTAQGLLIWLEGVPSLRDQLVRRGWIQADDRGHELTIHPDGEFAISVTSATGGVGDARRIPRTRAPKGVTTKDLVESNRQLSAWSEYPEWAGGRGAEETRRVWVLLIDIAGDEAHAELSLPSTIRDGYITGWEERILLRSQSPDVQGEALLGPMDDNDEPHPDVKRRSS